MFNNSIESVTRMVMNCGKRLRVGLLINILRSIRPDSMTPEQFEELLQYKIKEMITCHTIIALRDANSEPDSAPAFFAVPEYDPEIFDQTTIRNHAAAFWALFAYGKSGDSTEGISTFRRLSGLYPLDMPFQFLACFGNVSEDPDGADEPLTAFDFACMDPMSFKTSIAACKRVWMLQRPAGDDKGDSIKADINKLYKKRAGSQSTREPEPADSEQDDLNIEHVAVLLSFPSEYPKDILSRLTAAGFNHVVYRPNRNVPSWTSAKWRLLK